MSSQEQKINDLLDRLRHENPPPTPPRSAPQMASSGPSSGSPRNNGELPPPSRPSLPLSLGGGGSGRRRPQDLSFNSNRSTDSIETDRKLKEIMKISGNLTINKKLYKTDIKHMEHLEELGNGTCGHVVKMRHAPSGEIIAVKQMRRSGNSEENKRIIMDIEVVLKSHDCKYIVQCLGCFITDSEVWICMELMTTCFDKLLKRLGRPIPEEILGKVTVATVEALSYLKDKHGVIHRDVKPSNILLDTKGYVKLCDFGISGRLVDSMAKTRSAGCAAYLAPERIEPDPKNPDYDIRADVWSLGITLVELATGVFPYPDCNTDFEVLTKVIGQDPPSLPETFSAEFRDFVKCCLTKDQKHRPKYTKLKNHAFIKMYESKSVNVGDWVVNALQQADAVANRAAAPRHNTAQSIRRFFTSSHQRQQQQQPPPQQQPQQPVTQPINIQHVAQHFPVKVTNGNPLCQYKPLKVLDSAEAQQQPMLQPSQPSPPLSSAFVGLPPPSSGHISRLSTFQQGSRDSPTPPPSYQKTEPPSSYRPYSPFLAYQNHIAAANAKMKFFEQPPPDLKPSPQQQEKLSLKANLPDVALTVEQNRASPSLLQRRMQSNEGGGRWRSPSASPLPLRSQFQQQEQHQQQYNCGNTSPIILQRFYHQQKQQQLAKEAEESGKKRFASYIKLQLSGDRTSGRSSRHQSPEPPPRLHRNASGDSQSPLTLHRNFLESNPQCSPSLSRRYISPTPPVPPPRRLSESTSVPGSPQHLRARFHYTPEPQRRLYQNNDIS